MKACDHHTINRAGKNQPQAGYKPGAAPRRFLGSIPS